MKTTFGEARALAARILEAAGMPPGPAERTAWALTVAEVWGRPSHGLMRMAFYLPRFDQRGTNAAAELQLVRERAGVACFDGQNGLGHWQCWLAAEEAVRRAEAVGVAAVAVANSGHNGVLGLYVLPMVSAGMIGIAMSNGPAVMPPAGGRSAVLSTSPIAAGIPTSPKPTLIDLSTSAVARGRLAAAARSGESIPEGWAFDEHGTPTTDPGAALAGMVAPIAGAKGFALALLVEALTGGAAGPKLAGDIADSLTLAHAGRSQGSAHFLLAVEVAALDVDGQATRRLEDLAERIEASGGRLPGSSHPVGEELSDERELELPDKLGAELTTLAAAREVVIPTSFG